MKTYSKLINNYITSKDTDVKKLLHQKKIESSFTMELFLDDILFKCGLLTATTVLNLDYKTKYNAYINFSEDNLFQEKKGVKELIEKPISESEAEKILAKYIISYFDKVDYEKLKNRIS